jgi:5-methylcytosine-specific restriction endonuclease McrA
VREIRNQNKLRIKAAKRLINIRYELEKDSIRSLTAEQWEQCKIYFNYSCAYCGSSEAKLSKDHFIPLTGGGGLTYDNVIPACKACNSSKGKKDFYIWFRRQSFYSEYRENKILKYLNAFNE